MSTHTHTDWYWLWDTANWGSENHLKGHTLTAKQKSQECPGPFVCLRGKGWTAAVGARFEILHEDFLKAAEGLVRPGFQTRSRDLINTKRDMEPQDIGLEDEFPTEIELLISMIGHVSFRKYVSRKSVRSTLDRSIFFALKK